MPRFLSRLLLLFFTNETHADAVKQGYFVKVVTTGSNPVRTIFLEDYPSPAEGNGLENRQACKSVRGFESHILLIIKAGWSSSVARRAHNPKVVGSNPAPATSSR